MVYKDGSVGEFQFRKPADSRICNEVKRIIQNSGKWLPALEEDQPIDSKVNIRLTIIFEGNAP
jgi:hypothetical protein